MIACNSLIAILQYMLLFLLQGKYKKNLSPLPVSHSSVDEVFGESYISSTAARLSVTGALLLRLILVSRSDRIDG